MEKREFNVIRKDKEFANQKTSYIVMHNGIERRVPMYGFQEEKQCPKTIMCVIKDDGRIEQDLQSLLEKLYEIDKSYLFIIKKKWPTLKYYELEDKNLNDDTIKFRLPFSESNNKLEIGQQIKCRVTQFVYGRPYFKLEDANPSLLTFIDKETVFDGNAKFNKWLNKVMSFRFMANVAQLYEQHDGRWICSFSREVEKIIYSLLTSQSGDKENILLQFCSGWINTIEYSKFMGKLSEAEKQEFNNSLNHSIEVCEDFMDALSLPNKERRTAETIETLDPQYYQYRLERRLRFLACIFSSNVEILNSSIERLLEQIGKLGEKECSNESIYLSMAAILKMCANTTTDGTTNCLSLSGKSLKKIKHGILSLCYLIKIMHHHHDTEIGVYASRLYLLISLCMSEEKEKLQSLKNAYQCLFLTQDVIPQFKWEEFGNIVKTGLYQFCKHSIGMELAKDLYFDNDVACCNLSPTEIRLKPRNYNGDMEDFSIQDWLVANISYGKSLSRTTTEESFLSVRNTWNEAEKTVFTPVGKIEKHKAKLQDGDDVDIYITKILDEETARCKAVGYDDEEGTISFNDLFFYKKPQLSINDFIGTNGSPLVFPAKCKIDDDNITFDSNQCKIYFANDELADDEETSCFIISRKADGDYVGVTNKGLFVSIIVNNDELDIRHQHVKVKIISKNRYNGYATAQYVGLAEEPFNQKGVYARYIRLLNEYCYDGEYTLNDCDIDTNDDDASSQLPRRATTEQISALVDILNKLSETETNARRRYGYQATSMMMVRMIGDKEHERLLELRMKFTEMLYCFSLNNKLIEQDVEKYDTATQEYSNSPEIIERKNVCRILGKYGRWTKLNELDKDLIGYMEREDSSPLEKELARLVLSGCLLSNFQNEALHDKVLDEMGNALNIEIFKPKKTHIGEENQELEFKTSLVFPPNNRGNENLEQQTENIMRVILAMMNAKGGVLYIGVNDDGYAVGLYNDLLYFSYNGVYNEQKSKDEFKNYFSRKLSEWIGAKNAQEFSFKFINIDGYDIFRVEIPVILIDENQLIRVGTTIQKK